MASFSTWLRRRSAGEEGKSAGRKRRRRVAVTRSWLYLPLVALVSAFFGGAVVMIGPGLLPDHKATMLAVGVLLFPLFAGGLMAACLGGVRPWRALGRSTLATLGLLLLAWLINGAPGVA